MRPISIEGELLGLVQDSRFHKKKDTPEFVDLVIPERLDGNVLRRYLKMWVERGNPVSRSQLDALLELLLKAERFGHDINHLLTVATASGWSRVVFDNHLKPNEKTSS